MTQATTAYQKPIPLKDIDNAPYWDAADKHQLALQKCEDCNAYSQPPGPTCAKCGSANVSWEQFGDDIKATVYSYVVSYRPFLPGFQDELPTIIALGKLDQCAGSENHGQHLDIARKKTWKLACQSA